MLFVIEILKTTILTGAEWVIKFFLNKIKDRKKQNKEANEIEKRIKEIETHYFFPVMEGLCTHWCKEFMNSDFKKECVYKIFFFIKFTKFLNFGHEIVRMAKIGIPITLEYIESAVYRLIDEYEKKSIEMGVPLCFIEKFKKIHAPLVESTRVAFTDIARNEAGDDITKAKDILRCLLAAFIATRVQAEQTLSELNGELSLSLTAFDPSTHPYKEMLRMQILPRHSASSR